MRKQLSLFLIAAIGLAALPACVKSYKPVKLEPIAQDHADFEETTDHVTLRVKKFTQDDCVAMFGSRCKRLLNSKQAVYPLQLTIDNQSDSDWVLKKENVDLKLAGVDSVASRIKNGITPIFWTAAIGTTGAALTTYYAILVCNALEIQVSPAIMATLLLLPPIFIIGTPALIIAQALKNRTVSKQIARDLAQKALEDELYIPAHSTSTTLIFVKKKNFTDNFTVALTSDDDKEEEETKKIMFTVALLD